MKKSILKYFKAFTLVGVMASFIALSSCGEDDGGEPAATLTAYGILESESNLSKLKGEFDAYASITDILQDESADITVFAPSNAAMTTLLNDLSLEDFSTVSEDIATAVLSYHISQSAALATGDLAVGTTIMTEQGELITVEAGTKLKSGASNPSTITQSINATNGIVHIVDVVLVPPTIGAQIVQTLGKVAQPLLLGADFSIFAAGMAKADATATSADATIVAILAFGTDVTVFAQTNATFAGVTVDSYTAEEWNSIIRNQIVIGQGGSTPDVEDDVTLTLGEADFYTGASYTTVAQGTLFFVNSGSATNVPGGPGIYFDGNGDFNGETGAGLDAEFAKVDAAPATNGRVHVIAGPGVLPGN